MSDKSFPNSGILNHVPKKGDRAPDLRGRAEIGDKFYSIAGWKKMSTKGKEFLSLSFQEMTKEEYEAAQNYRSPVRQNRGPAFSEEDVPFN